MALTLALLLGTAGLLVWAFDDDDDDNESSSETEVENEVLRGDEGDNLLEGSDNVNTIYGEGGDDIMPGAGENDRIFGSDGEDIGLGGDGDDLVRGGADDDTLIGGGGSDDLKGDTGDDVIIAAELVNEEALEAFLTGEDTDVEEDDVLDFSAEQDAAPDTVNGGFGYDLLLLGAEDEAMGGGGDDTFELGSWIEPGKPATITDYDGDEDEILYYLEGDAEPEISVVSEDDGTATVLADGQPFLIVPNAGDSFEASSITLVELATDDEEDDDSGSSTGNVVTRDDDDSSLLVGSDEDDSIFGNGGNDTILGAAGDDRLFGADDSDYGLGGEGDDLVRGGADDDTLIGGTGSDDLRGDGGDDVLVSAEVVDEQAVQSILTGEDTVTPIASTTDFDAEVNPADDEVDGGGGDDLLIMGAGDSGSGGGGEDAFQLGSWIDPGNPATISDFDASEDQIVYSFEGDAAPTITVSTDEDGTATVSANGEPFLVVPNAGENFGASSITLASLGN